jgi:hypothetical protein
MSFAVDIDLERFHRGLSFKNIFENLAKRLQVFE